MPDAPEQKKGKGKHSKEDTRVWGSCPLLPGVPPPDIIIPQHIIARVMQSAGTPSQTTPESVMDITNAIQEMHPPLHTIGLPGTSKAELETVPPARTPPRDKNRAIQFTPSTGIIQSTVLPQNPLSAQIEFVGFTPSSSITTTTPGSGSSAYELNIDVDIERDFAEPGEGSDIERDDLLVDTTLNPRRIDEYQADCANLDDPLLDNAITRIDADADLALRNDLGPGADEDLLHFDWRGEPENFEGVREVFTVPSTGPTFESAELTPMEVFLKIWDADIIAHIVCETNRYGGAMVRRTEKRYSRLQRWTDVTDSDIRNFFAIIMLQSH